MGNEDASTTAKQRFLAGDEDKVPSVQGDPHLHIAALEATIEQLREANQNLVLAAVHAQSSRDDAEAANRRQNEFLAMLAHELRNPLAPIGMASTLLARVPNANPQLINLAQVIGRQVEHMSHLLDDLLDAARISSGKITLSPEPVLLSEVINQAVETVNPRITERRQRLAVTLPPQDVVLHGDKVRLTQVFTNLLGNASKYTGDAGSINLSAALADGLVEVTVDDNGAGIADDVLPFIFDLFTQGPRSLARSEGGLGVGLNVVRNLVAMHGGRVDASSDGLGAGSSFTVVLPVSNEAPAAVQAQRQPARDNQKSRVLIIEDNVDACDTMMNFLSLEGHTVSVAYDGTSGLALAAAGDYDVLICDIGLPGMDGLDLIRSLRGAHGAGQPFAIALSGYCQSEDRVRALDAGFDHYLVKPCRPEELVALIGSEQCQGRGRKGAAAPLA